MPNHVINEIIFRGLDTSKRSEIMANAVNAAGDIDFRILLPVPLNAWQSSVSLLHEKAFKLTALDWARENWGTKWNAYGIDQGGKYRSVYQDGDCLILTFQTAWRPPYGWIVALFNRFKVSFEHNWLSEGGEPATCGAFRYEFYEDDMHGRPWEETAADQLMTRHLHKLLWGVEEFPPEEDDEVA